MRDLDDEARARYARQLALPAIGPAGQAKLRAGRVLLVGAGGLGSPAALYLAAAGVGTLGIVDGDVVDVSNLQRQILFATADVGRPKAEAAAARLAALNPETVIEARRERLTAENGGALVAAYDFVIDATDNFAAKFLIADLCHAAGKPYVHGGILEFVGQAMTVLPGRTACYRCVFDGPPAETGNAPRGPLGVVPGIIGSVQAAEAIKYLTGAGTLLTDRLLVVDTLAMLLRTVRVRRSRDCSLCGESTFRRHAPVSPAGQP
jgi:molybdopterin-synthase adenylyltransferase